MRIRNMSCIYRIIVSKNLRSYKNVKIQKDKKVHIHKNKT